jgi:hypothetical protein
MTVYLASKALTGVQPKVLPSAAGVNNISVASLTTALALNDTVNFMYLAADASDPDGQGPSIVEVTLDAGQLDTGGGITLSLGDQVAGAAATPTRFLNASTVAQTGGLATPTVAGTIGYQPFASSFAAYTSISNLLDLIYMTCAHAPTVWQNGRVALMMGYTYDA